MWIWKIMWCWRKLGYENCKCRKRLVDKWVEECSENTDGKELHSNKMVYNSTLNVYGKNV